MGSRVIVALDFPDASQALAFSAQLMPAQCRLKIGLELFTVGGPSLVSELNARGFDVFLDLKFHDIPATVANACARAAALGMWMMNVHTLGGPAMLAAARQAVSAQGGRPLLVGVTVLTSHDERSLSEIGIPGSVADTVARLAASAQTAGLDGVVCSAREAAALRRLFGPEFVLVTPGIRPAGSTPDDQRRTMTPAEAIRAGSDYLVIGRPVTRATKPQAVLAAINAEIDGVLSVSAR